MVEFLKEYQREAAGERQRLLADAPGPVGDERWDVLFAGLDEHLATRDGKDIPGWSASRGLRHFWFPFDAPGARAQALRIRWCHDGPRIRLDACALSMTSSLVHEVFPEEEPPARLRLLLGDIFSGLDE